MMTKKMLILTEVNHSKVAEDQEVEEVSEQETLMKVGKDHPDGKAGKEEEDQIANTVKIETTEDVSAKVEAKVTVEAQANIRAMNQSTSPTKRLEKKQN